MRFQCCYLISGFIILSVLFTSTDACRRNETHFIDITEGHELLVGSELVLNCTLRNRTFPEFPKMSPISSSDLAMDKLPQFPDLSNFTRIIDDYTIQLKIRKAQVKDSGTYICRINLPNVKIFDCITNVTVYSHLEVPRNVSLTPFDTDKILINWIPPLLPHGKITHFLIIANDTKLTLDTSSISEEQWQQFEDQEMKFWIYGLKPYSLLTVQIQACFESDCSAKSEAVQARTAIGEPGLMKPPRIKEVNSTHVNVSWIAPETPNGPIDYYEIKWHQDKLTDHSYNTLEVSGASNSVILDVSCPSLEPEAIKYLFYVRAVNMWENTTLVGPLSDSADAMSCLKSNSEPGKASNKPGLMKPPYVKVVNSTYLNVSWIAPATPNGPIDHYEIKWHQEKLNVTYHSYNTLEVSGASNSVILYVSCPSLEPEAIKYLFYVRAVNMRENRTFFGPLSQSADAMSCLNYNSEPETASNRVMFIGTIVGALFGVLLLAAIFGYVIRTRSIKCRRLRNSTSTRSIISTEDTESNSLV